MKQVKQYITGLMALCLILAILPLATAASGDADVENHPGYVDFSRLAALANVEPTVEVSLKAPLLNMATSLIRAEDEDAADFISKLLRVTVQVFEDEDLDVEAMSETIAEITSEMDTQGWERVVRVRDDDDHVDVYFRLSDAADMIHGIAVMVVDENETALVNVVGDISANDITELARRFDIDELKNYDNSEDYDEDEDENEDDDENRRRGPRQAQ
ncbi:MAG: DUF4252 domain-containing protein [Pseudohongiellaceae bacterium]